MNLAPWNNIPLSPYTPVSWWSTAWLGSVGAVSYGLKQGVGRTGFSLGATKVALVHSPSPVQVASLDFLVPCSFEPQDRFFPMLKISLPFCHQLEAALLLKYYPFITDAESFFTIQQNMLAGMTPTDKDYGGPILFPPQLAQWNRERSVTHIHCFQRTHREHLLQ